MFTNSDSQRENDYMKKRKGRIILGTTAVAAALTLGGCAGSTNPSAEAGSSTAFTAQESTENTADLAQSGTEKTADPAQAQQGATTESSAEASSAGAGNTIGDFEVFDPIDNINEVVYGPPQD